MAQVRVAAAQFECVVGDVVANVRQIAELAQEARAAGSAVMVCPELALTGYEPGLIGRDRTLWTEAEDARLDPLRGTGITVVVNGAAAGPGGRPQITSTVYAPDGSVATVYAKEHLYENEREVFEPGSGGGRFWAGGVGYSLATCFDNHFPEVSGRNAAQGCRVHLASSLYGTGGGREERRTVHPAIAKATGMYVVLANHVGPAGPWTGCGGSAVWAPDGTVVAEADESGPRLLVADLEVETGD
ncbi:carbon-nitrogen hydrolase family protein [Kitasatospora sp. YST-16]|uniref:carbon-nitrogen hydrolase family protein n=1 Tax=Kitasatospora sp. YST-16 TaxID=2998080 RepID=UPI00228358BD|nr:carbon-nitrogen hydrolase family protein [Kitasatospora sp. YST-16]WAL76015.1 carbon-nitrogen hydrolase family protein [Kitasatospora sp. YST-16]WNW42070.1 carbon-nitrogen hydrolase family protein [Streptomyces sp. Li-HN-5-13]